MNPRAWARSALSVPVWGLLVTAATTLALFPLSQSHAFWLTGLGGAALVVATGIACRALRVLRPYTVPVQLSVLVLWAALLVSPREAWFGLPTPDTAATLAGDIGQVLELARERAAPLPASPALSTVLALGIALLALLVDVVAVAARRAAVVGLLQLGVYMVPVATLSGQVSAHVFWPGALAWTGLLLAGERLNRSHWSGGSAESRGAEASADDVFGTRGRQVALSAVGIAVILPLLLPAASLRLFGSGGTLGVGSGLGSDVITVDNPVLDLRRNLVEQPRIELVRVRTDDPTPAYLRTTVLDEFTGDRWQPSSREEDQSVDADSDQLPAPPGLSAAVATREVDYEVTLTSAFASAWLPVVYAPTTIDADGDWRVDENTLDVVIADQDEQATSTTYTFTATIPEPTPEQLRTAPPPPASLEDLTELPAGLPAIIGSQARTLAAGISSPYDQALNIERWFRADGGFVYTTEPRGGTGEETIAAFVTDEREGYCEQFASAMALMARSLGIPARVAVGFLRPEREGSDTWSYQGRALHTWPELYFSGAGWVRFEPTPPDRTGGGAEPAPAQGQPQDNRIEPEADVAPVGPNSANPSGLAPLRALIDEPVPVETRLDNRVIAALLVLLTVALVPRAWCELRRRRRWSRAEAHPAAAPEEAWEELADSLVDLGHPWDPARTPRASGRSLRPVIDHDRASVAALNRLVRAVERARYAGPQPAEPSAGPDPLRADVDTVLATVAGVQSRWHRHLARWLPRSLLPIGRMGTASADGSSAGGWWRRLRAGSPA